MFEGNKQFEAFRDKLNASGVYLLFMWDACSGIERRDSRPVPAGLTTRQWGALGTKRPDVAMVTFCRVGKSDRLATGECPVEKLAVGSAILIDYGDDGFDVWLQPGTNSIDDDVAAILGAPEPQTVEKEG